MDELISGMEKSEWDKMWELADDWQLVKQGDMIVWFSRKIYEKSLLGREPISTKPEE